MRIFSTRNRFILAASFCAAVAATAEISGYTLSGRTWATSTVLYYVNPQNVRGLSQAAILDSLQRGAAVWREQSRANIELVYAGTTGGSSFGLNNKNEVFFRNTQSSFGGETYWWYNYAGRLVDFDMGFYEGGYAFYTVPGTCSGSSAVYLDDIAVHEFGHALGLEHSPVAGATMAPRMPSYCDTTQMTLDPDDIAGIERAYPAPVAVARPSAPSQVSVVTPATNATSSLAVAWADGSNDETGFRLERSTDGSNFSQVAQLGANVTSYLSAGLSSGTTYYYRVYAYNSGGSSSYSAVASGRTATPPAPAPAPAPTPAPAPAPAPTPTPVPPPSVVPTVPTPTLTIVGTRSGGSMRMVLSWAGIAGKRVDIYRNGSRLTTTSNDGAYDNGSSKKSATFQYRVCLSGSSSICTNTATFSY